MDARAWRFGAALAVDGADVLRFALLAARTPAADGGRLRALRWGNAAAGLLGWAAAAAVLAGLLRRRPTVRGRRRCLLLLLGAALTDGGAAAVALAARARSDPRSRRVVAESAHLLLGGSAITAVYLRVLGGGPPVEAA